MYYNACCLTKIALLTGISTYAFSLVFRSYCWWEALLCSCILQSLCKANNFLEPVDNKEGEKKDADNNAVVSVVSVIRNTFWVGSAHPVKAAPAKKRTTWKNLVPDLLLLDSRALAWVKVFDMGVDMCQDPADLSVLLGVQLLIIMMTWTWTCIVS